MSEIDYTALEIDAAVVLAGRLRTRPECVEYVLRDVAIRPAQPTEFDGIALPPGMASVDLFIRTREWLERRSAASAAFHRRHGHYAAFDEASAVGPDPRFC